MITTLTMIFVFFLSAVVVGVCLLVLFKGTILVVSVIGRIINFIFGVIADLIMLVMNLLGVPFAAFFAIVMLILGRWRSANGQARLLGDRLLKMCTLLVSLKVLRPLRLFFLDDAATYIAQRLPCQLPDGPMILATSPASASSSRSGTPIPDSRVSNGLTTESFTNFSIIGQLPSGGSGARLFVAHSQKRRGPGGKRLPETVVIKSFTLQDGSNLPSIVRESRALESAKRIGLVLEHHLEDERFWYVMPYHAGPTLTQAVQMIHDDCRDQGRLDDAALSELIQFVRDLLETLDHFHRSGLWHKDVKPDNLIVHDDKTHLVDLGLMSSLSSSLTLTTHGTEYFRDPELVRMALRGVKVHEIDGAKFDIFGAGAVLYFVLANDFPAQGGLSRFKNDVPPALDWIVRRAMADYDKRYEVVADMLADLEAFAASDDPWAMVPADLPSLGGRAVTATPARASFRPGLASIVMPSPPPLESPVPPPPPPIKPVHAAGHSRIDVPSDRPTAMLLGIGGFVLVLMVLVIGSWVFLGPLEAHPVLRVQGGASSYSGSHVQLVSDSATSFEVNEEEVVLMPLYATSDSPELPTVMIGWHSAVMSEDSSMSERLDGLLDDYLIMGYGGLWDERVPNSAERADAWHAAAMSPEQIIVLPLNDSEKAQFIRDSLALDFHGPFAPGLLRLTEEIGVDQLIFLTGGDAISVFDITEVTSFEDVPLKENVSQ